MSQPRLRVVLLLGLLLLGLSGLGAWQVRSHSMLQAPALTSIPVAEITVEVLVQGDQMPIRFIDVRTPSEYAEDHIEGSPLIPITEIESGQAHEQIERLIAETRQTLHADPIVVLYCTRGIRSGRAQQHLQSEGIRTLSLQGGIRAWRQVVSPENELVLLPTLTHRL